MATPSKPNIAVIVPVSERYDRVRELYTEYKSALDTVGQQYTVTYVLDGHFPDVSRELDELRAEGEPIRIVRLAKWFGEATALTAGFENADGDIILTLPAYYQVDPSEIPKVVSAAQAYDMAIGRRFPRRDSTFNRIQTRFFNWLLNAMTGSSFRDLGCGVRAFKREVATEIPVYGDQHRFLPLLANRRGFRIKEVDLAQSTKEASIRVYRLGVYPRRLLDLLTVFFLVKFTKKPLRFFGLIGIATFVVGGLITSYLVFDRFFGGTPLGDRPALLLSSLLMVLGVQIFAIGLIGELIIFTHAKDIKEYTIEEIIN